MLEGTWRRADHREEMAGIQASVAALREAVDRAYPWSGTDEQ